MRQATAHQDWYTLRDWVDSTIESTWAFLISRSPLDYVWVLILAFVVIILYSDRGRYEGM